jgi:hypothetical protein
MIQVFMENINIGAANISTYLKYINSISWYLFQNFTATQKLSYTNYTCSYSYSHELSKSVVKNQTKIHGLFQSKKKQHRVHELHSRIDRLKTATRS